MDDPSFNAKGPRPGKLSIDTTVSCGDDAIWLLTQLGTELCLLLFVDKQLFISSETRRLRDSAYSFKPKMKIIFVSNHEISDQNGCFNSV